MKDRMTDASNSSDLMIPEQQRFSISGSSIPHLDKIIIAAYIMGSALILSMTLGKIVDGYALGGVEASFAIPIALSFLVVFLAGKMGIRYWIFRRLHQESGEDTAGDPFPSSDELVFSSIVIIPITILIVLNLLPGNDGLILMYSVLAGLLGVDWYIRRASFKIVLNIFRDASQPAREDPEAARAG